MSNDSPPQPKGSPSEPRNESAAFTTRFRFEILFVAYAAFLIVSLPQYGPTWDVIYEFPRATAFVSHAIGEKTPSDISPWHRLSYEDARSTHGGSLNGCLPSLIAAAAGVLFYQELQLLDHIDAYHLGLVLLWLLFVLHFHSRLVVLHGPRLALVATVLLALAPRVLAHVPNNMKDIPALAFGTAGLLELAVAVTMKRPRRIYLTALLVACAVSSKFVAAFVALPGVVLLYLGLRDGRRFPRIPAAFLVPLATIPIATVAVLIAHWPYLWEPPSGLWARFLEMASVIGERAASGASSYPFTMAAITTPPLLLAGLVSAAVASFRKPAESQSERTLFVFYAVWMVGVLVVFSSGRIELFDGIRHFILFMPPGAILSAWGILRASDFVLEKLANLGVTTVWPNRLGAPLLVLVSALSVASYHPYEVTYFNSLVGGLRGATKVEFDDNVLDFEPRDYWGTSVRASVDWANRNLPEGSALWVSLPAHFAEYGLFRLRPDLVYALPFERQAGRPHYLVFNNRERWFTNFEKRVIARGKLVHQEEIQGVPLSFVYRLPN